MKLEKRIKILQKLFSELLSHNNKWLILFNLYDQVIIMLYHM